MSTIKAKVQTNQSQITAKKLAIGQFSIALSDITNVDTTGQTDGAMMIYDGASGQYKIQTQINNSNLIIIGGTY